MNKHLSTMFFTQVAASAPLICTCAYQFSQVILQNLFVEILCKTIYWMYRPNNWMEPKWHFYWPIHLLWFRKRSAQIILALTSLKGVTYYRLARFLLIGSILKSSNRKVSWLSLQGSYVHWWYAPEGFLKWIQTLLLRYPSHSLIKRTLNLSVVNKLKKYIFFMFLIFFYSDHENSLFSIGCIKKYRTVINFSRRNKHTLMALKEN